MFEKVNKLHPDKIADRIAGAIVDLCYKEARSVGKRPICAVEVLIGHGQCLIINETNVVLSTIIVEATVRRISGCKHSTLVIHYLQVPQDVKLAKNQEVIHCGDNGIFKGMPITQEQKDLTNLVERLFKDYGEEGKYIIHDDKIIACQARLDHLPLIFVQKDCIVNPLGYWIGGLNTDSGAVNRKLGSDMGDAVTGGGLHGKDLSKADVSVNIVCHLLAQQYNCEVTAVCAIGDEDIAFRGECVDLYLPYYTVVEMAQDYINEIGGFEKFAEWGLIRPCSKSI